mgnify:CR=1 FL=1
MRNKRILNCSIRIPHLELIESGIPKEFHHFLKYQHVTREEAYELVGYKLSGWVVPFCDPKGNPYLHQGKPFYRLKPDPEQLRGDDPPKYLTPKDAGCRPYFSRLATEKKYKTCKKLFITEGEKKADSLTHYDFPCIALSGVNSWKDKRSGESKPLPELEALNWKNRQVYLVFDSDIVSKIQVLQALQSFCEFLKGKEAKVLIILLPNELNRGKNGADDFLKRHGKQAFSELIRIARPAFHYCKRKKEDVFTWKPEPSETHHIALMASIIFQDFYAERSGIGLYRWKEKYWEKVKGKSKEEILKPLHQWLDVMDFHKRSCSHISSITGELLARLNQGTWDPTHLIAFSNGTLDLQQNKLLHGHNSKDLISFLFPFPFDQSAQCPTWINFLQETFPEQEVQNLLRASLKWTITPKDSEHPFPYEVAFDVHGPRGCGKGTISEVLTALCGGSHGAGIVRSESFNNSNSLAALIGKKIAIDPDSSGHIKDPGIFNSMVTNEPVEVHVLYKDRFAVRLGVVIWRFFNDMPTASGGGLEGMGRRLVTFRITNSPKKRDSSLKQKLQKEIAGIFQWCWKMGEQEMQEAFKNRGSIPSIQEATIENLLESRPVLRFLIENYQDGISSILGRNLYHEYRDWAKETGLQPVKETKFGLEVKKVVGWVVSTKTKYGVNYQIKPMSDFNLTDHFGFECIDEGLNSPPELTLHPNSPPVNPSNGNDSKTKVKGMKGLSLSFNQEKKQNKNCIYKGVEQTHHTHHTQHQETLNLGSYDTARAKDDDDPHWGPRSTQ